jgi:hypothetical protein
MTNSLNITLTMHMAMRMRGMPRGRMPMLSAA